MSRELDICFSHAGIGLVQTCWACPEQYDAFNGCGERVGYLRLRHGYFRVQVPDVGGEVVYDARPEGDGCFGDDEREGFLEEACRAIRRHQMRERRRS